MLSKAWAFSARESKKKEKVKKDWEWTELTHLFVLSMTSQIDSFLYNRTDCTISNKNWKTSLAYNFLKNVFVLNVHMYLIYINIVLGFQVIILWSVTFQSLMLTRLVAAQCVNCAILCSSSVEELSVKANSMRKKMENSNNCFIARLPLAVVLALLGNNSLWYLNSCIHTYVHAYACVVENQMVTHRSVIRHVIARDCDVIHF